jgi:menaquinone-specific isochorismate synthase
MTWTVESPSPVVVPIGEASQAAARLVARTVPLPDGADGSGDVDVLAVGGSVDALLWQREAFALAGRGIAMRLVLPSGLDGAGAAAAVLETLQAIPTDDEVGRPGCGPVVLAALPFDRQAPATLTIPAATVGRDVTGQRWITTVGPPDAGFEVLATLADLPEYTPPDSFSLVSPRAHTDWAALVAATVTEVRAGHFDKIVLAREIEVVANRDFLPADILRRLHTLYPSCMVFSTGTFLGASPELLISRLGRRVRSHPLAGTVARSGDPAADAALTGLLLGSAKEREEHRLVVDAVASALQPVCRALDVPEVPSIVALRNVSHLGTFIEGELEGDDVTALELVSRLHPTPAVAGSPTAAAVAYLTKVEGFDRGCYAGPVGWMDSRGDGEWAVAIRSAEVRGHTARLFAGVGIVSDSEPASELAETQLKLQALLAAVVRP